jgi:hypothetical protein
MPLNIPKSIPCLTGGDAVITEYSATSSRAVQVHKFEVYGPYTPHDDDVDMRNARELRITYVLPKKRKSRDSIRILSGTARSFGNRVIDYDSDGRMRHHRT